MCSRPDVTSVHWTLNAIKTPSNTIINCAQKLYEAGKVSRCLEGEYMQLGATAAGHRLPLPSSAPAAAPRRPPPRTLAIRGDIRLYWALHLVMLSSQLD